jgi:hypothetical protein
LIFIVSNKFRFFLAWIEIDFNIFAGTSDGITLGIKYFLVVIEITINFIDNLLDLLIKDLPLDLKIQLTNNGFHSLLHHILLFLNLKLHALMHALNLLNNLLHLPINITNNDPNPLILLLQIEFMLGDFLIDVLIQLAVVGEDVLYLLYLLDYEGVLFY